MTILLLILIVVLIILLFRLFIVKEGFQSQELNPEITEDYSKFILFYNPFCANWQKAIQSSVASELPQQPLTDPSQVYSSSNATSTISESDMNAYITQLSQQLSQPLPPICKALPSTIDSSSLPNIIKEIPQSTQPFINALNWMNAQLEKSQANLGSALQGNTVEAFDNSGADFSADFSTDVCQNISSCLSNNPELVKQLALNISEQNSQQQQQQLEQQETQLIEVIKPFLIMPELSQAFNQNTALVQKAQEVQDQAQSGELINKINVPGGNTVNTYEKPPGANKLIDMKENNPDKYNEIQQNYGQWFSIKKTLDQINAAL
jgi:hypothetical protein